MHTDWDAAWSLLADTDPPAPPPSPPMDAELPEPPLWGPLVVDNTEEFLALYGPEALEDARLVALDEGW